MTGWEFSSTFKSPCFLPDAGAGLEDVEVLQDVRDGHQPECAEEPQPDPGAVQVDRDEGGRDGEVVHEGVKLQHKPELRRSDLTVITGLGPKASCVNYSH